MSTHTTDAASRDTTDAASRDTTDATHLQMLRLVRRISYTDADIQ
jgi:hypothetical protein